MSGLKLKAYHCGCKWRYFLGRGQEDGEGDHYPVIELSDTRTCGGYWVGTRAKVAKVTADAFRRAQTHKPS